MQKFSRKSENKKILFVLNTDKFLLSHRIEIAKELLKNNYEVHLGSEKTEVSSRISNYGIKPHEIYINRSKIGILDLIKTTFSIYRLIKRVDPDIIHFISIKPVILGCIATKFYQKDIKIVTSISGLGFIFVAKGFIGNLRRFITCFLYKIALSNKKIKIIFQNKTDKNFINQICKLSNDQSIIISGSGVNLNKFKPTKVKAKNKIILLPARIVKSKGIYEFISAAETLKGEANFVLCGDYDFQAKDYINSEEINFWVKRSVIKFIGYKNNVQNIISKSTIIILPSYREGLPKVLCEAAACGIPVITTDVPGCRDAIINGKTGILVPPRKSKELSNAIKELLYDKKLLKKMGKAGRKLAINKFDVKKVVEKHLKIYENII